MAIRSVGPHSVSNFLRSYAPDRFEWESPDYCPRTRFLWSKPLTVPPQPHKASSEQDATSRDGVLSPGSESVSDMSISLSDMSSGQLFAALPPMNRARSTSTSAAHRPISGADARSFSDMSISGAAASSSSNTLENFEKFAGNVPDQTSCEPALPVNASLLDDSVSCLIRNIDPGTSPFDGDNDDNSDAAAVDSILEWTTSLFTAVANSVLNYSIQPGVADISFRTLSCRPESISVSDDLETASTATTRDVMTDDWPAPTDLIVKLNSVHPVGLARPIEANPLSILMSGAIDYEAINPEQPTTSKPVCMWGRRLERIPKVRLTGQKEAVYCFDARKQRQKQKGGNQNQNSVLTRQFGGNGGGFQAVDQPTQIFYRARPLYSSFVRKDLPATPVDAVKIAQGQVLLQNVTPVRFASAPSSTQRRPAFGHGGAGATAASRSFQRLPLTLRTNGPGPTHGDHVGSTSPPPWAVRKIPGAGFL